MPEKSNSPLFQLDQEKPEPKSLGAMRIALFGLLMGLSSVGCKNSASKDKKTEAVKPAEEPNKSEVRPHEFETVDGLFVDMPQVEFTNKPYKYPKPAGIDCSDEVFVTAAEYFVYKSDHLIKKLKKSFDMAPELKAPGIERSVFFEKFIVALGESAATDDALRAYILDNKHKIDLEFWADHLKPIFIAGGVYFDLARVPHGLDDGTGQITESLELQIYRIDSTETVKISDKKGVEEAPVLTLGERLFDLDEFSQPGRYDTKSGLALFYQGNADVNKAVDTLMDYGLLKTRPHDMNSVQREHDRDTKIHEAGHYLASKRYRHGGNASPFAVANMTFSVQGIDQSGAASDVRGQFGPIHLTELYAVGLELFHSKADPPIDFLNYFGVNNYSYLLANQLLTRLSIKFLSMGDGKDEIMDNFRRGISMPSADVADIMSSELDFHQIKKVAAEMHRMAAEGFAGMEGKEFKR